MWTALPNGINGDKLRLTVFISPQLFSDAAMPRLNMFSDWLLWTQKMQGATFKVGFRNPVLATPDVILDATRTSEAPSNAHWQAIFNANTWVRPYKSKDYPERLIRSYSVRNIIGHVKKLYQDVALDFPGDRPKPKDLSTKLDGYCFYEIPKRTRPKTSGKFTNDSVAVSANQNKQQDSRTYKRSPFTEEARKAFYASISDKIANFVPSADIKKNNPNNSDQIIKKFQKRIKQDYLFLAQDPSTQLCSQANRGLSLLYQQLAQFKCVPPSAPDKTLDFLQMALYYKPRNAVNENYMATRFLRHLKKTGKPFYYDGVNKKYSTKRNAESSEFMPYNSELLHEGEVNPHVMATMVTPKFDFHDIVNALNRYPWILRKLGLAIDLEVPKASVPAAALASPCHVYVIPSWSQDNEAGVPKTNYHPRTAYYLDAAIFSAAPRTPAKPESLHGLLTVGNNDYYDVYSLEPGGAAIKMMHTFNGLTRWTNRFSPIYIPDTWNTEELNPESTDNDSDAAVSHLQNNGIALSRHGYAASVVQTLQMAKTSVTKIASKETFVAANNVAAANAVDPTNVLYAEDITRGWRADIYDKDDPAATWRTLMARDGKYQFMKDASLNTIVSDEGFASPSASQSSDGSVDDFYAGETLFEWSGWSLVASRPMKTVSKDEFKGDGSVDIIEPNSTSPSSDGTNIISTFLASGKSLPKLRYGHTYNVRARTVDLAGNSWNLGSVPTPAAAPNTVSPDTKLLRLDVVKTPTLLLRDAITKDVGAGKIEPLSHAESLEQMVVRSNRGKSTEEYSTDHTEFKSDTLRYVAPPKVDYFFAEKHGVFDKKYYDASDYAGLYSLITGRDYNFDNASSGGYTCFKQDPGTKDPIVIGTFKLPYLPDPLAKGIVLRGLPGTRAVVNGGGVVTKSAKLFYFRSDGAKNVNEDTDNYFKRGIVVIEYPNAKNPADWIANYPGDSCIMLKLIELKDGTDPEPEWDSSSQTLTIKISKSDVWRVQYSSFLKPKDAEELFMMHSWLSELPNNDARKRSLRHIAASAHWMLTPYRNLMLVHAVQQPLKDPSWYKQSLTRQIGETTAYITDEGFTVHGKSTVKVDITATWEDQVDNTTFDKPEDVYKENYDASDPDKVDRKAREGSAHVGEQMVNKRHAESIVLSMTHDFRDTKHRLVKFQPIGTTRFREYFPQTGYEFTVKGPIWKKHVPSTARPDAIKLQYIVPVFAWAEKASSAGADHIRMTGLRVYMERPWFSSGNEEKLGVVLATAGTNTDTIQNTPLAKLVTMWGYDPIWLSKPTPSELFPNPAFFLTKTKDLEQSEMNQGVIKDVTIDELSNDSSLQQQYKVDVALHDVYYDAERKLWYSDIMLAHGESYFPFIRLALCRIQPYSLRSGTQDVFISRITQADFMQIMPMRKTAVVYDPSDSKAIRVTVEGVSYRASVVGAVEGEVEVTLEEQTPSMGTDFGWTEISTTPIDRVNASFLGGYWGGVIKLPKERSATKYRVVIKEYEQFHADLIPGETAAATLSSSLKRTLTKVERRIVFADTIELS